ncbi:hypothetical protein KC322_g20382, partial [Hortaea werneckii]
ALTARPERTSNLSLASPVHSPEAENTKADHQDVGGDPTLLQRSEKEDERKAVGGQNTTPLANQYSCTTTEDSSRDVSSGDRVLERSRNPPAYTENATKVTQQLQLQDVTQNANSGGETLTDRSGSLPSVGQILERNRETTPSRQNDILSASSSPLSEREVSPPPGFVLPLADRQTSILISQHPDSNERLGSNVDDAIDDMELAQALQHPETATAARRSLRTRKEKQLHPYEYEKAIYQRQMRQRGYKPIRFAEQDERTRQSTQDRAYSEGENSRQRQDQRQQDEYSIPPSPPSTSSGSHHREKPVFRLPHNHLIAMQPVPTRSQMKIGHGPRILPRELACFAALKP